MKPLARKSERLALAALGWLCVALGTAGIVIPLLPTTCFLLGAACCFGRSSPRLERWLLGNRLFGDYLTFFRRDRAVPLSLKCGSIGMLWVGLSGSILLLSVPLWVDLALLGIGAAVTWHVASLQTVEVS